MSSVEDGLFIIDWLLIYTCSMIDDKLRKLVIAASDKSKRGETNWRHEPKTQETNDDH